jgi:hypothetical protein
MSPVCRAHGKNQLLGKGMRHASEIPLLLQIKRGKDNLCVTHLIG